MLDAVLGKSSARVQTISCGSLTMVIVGSGPAAASPNAAGLERPPRRQLALLLTLGNLGEGGSAAEFGMSSIHP